MVFDEKKYIKEWREKNKGKIAQHEKNRRSRASRIQYMKDFRKSPNGIKSNKIVDWKRWRIECNSEWDEVYEWYSSTTNCNICDKLFVESNDKCLDHDHELQGYNVRAILCKKCNNYYNEI